MEEGPKMPQEPIGDKKEGQKQFAKKVELPENIVELKKREDKRSWLEKKYDEWRHQK